MKLVIISDTHLMHSQIFGGVPDGDVLIHAGDSCSRGTPIDLGMFLEWFARRPHKHKIFIAGNHDTPLEQAPEWCAALAKDIDPGLIYLRDSGTEIEGVKFWGAPWQPEFCDWSFNLPRGKALAEKWKLIPMDTDVLITHGPPHGILDTCPDNQPRQAIPVHDIHVGCRELARRVAIVRPKLHCFGHIHESYGMTEKAGITYINASNVTGAYQPLNPAMTFEL